MDNDITQEVIAKFLNVSIATYSRYESGEIEMTSSTLDKLAEFFETSIDYLLGRTDKKIPCRRCLHEINR